MNPEINKHPEILTQTDRLYTQILQKYIIVNTRKAYAIDCGFRGWRREVSAMMLTAKDEAENVEIESTLDLEDGSDYWAFLICLFSFFFAFDAFC